MCYLTRNGLTMRSKGKSRYLETNENEKTTTQNPWGTVKAVLPGIGLSQK